MKVYVHVDSLTLGINLIRSSRNTLLLSTSLIDESGHQLWDVQNRKIIRSRNVIFNEHVMYNYRSISESKKCTFIKYAIDEFGCQFWDDQNRKIIRSRNIIFNEKMVYKYRSISKAKNADINTEKHKYDELEGSVRVKCEWSLGNSKEIYVLGVWPLSRVELLNITYLTCVCKTLTKF